MKYWAKAVSLSLAVSMTTLSFFSAFAADYDSQKKEQNQIIEDSQTKKEQIQKSLDKIIENITATSNQLSAAEDELNKVNDSLTKNQAALKEAQEKEQQQTESLRKRLRAIYEDGSLSYFNILMSSESIFDFFYKIEIIKEITEYDNNLLNTIKSTRAEIEDKQQQIEADKTAAEEKKAVVASKKQELDAQSQEKKDLINKENENIEAAKARLAKIEAEEERTRREIAAREAEERRKAEEAAKKNGTVYTPVVYNASGMIWPVPSCHIITSDFKMRTHPTTGEYKLHTGIDIGCRSGSSVLAAQSGTVITAGYNIAYGHYIVISHGNGVSTLYAHNSSLLVSVGQTVKQGQTIARSGNTGYSTGPHMHFEVLINGNPVNPRGYVSP